MTIIPPVDLVRFQMPNNAPLQNERIAQRKIDSYWKKGFPYPIGRLQPKDAKSSRVGFEKLESEWFNADLSHLLSDINGLILNSLFLLQRKWGLIWECWTLARRDGHQRQLHALRCSNRTVSETIAVTLQYNSHRSIEGADERRQKIHIHILKTRSITTAPGE